MDSLYVVKSEKRICQGDIFHDVKELTVQTASGLARREVIFPYVVILTQDCDLSEDFMCREGLREGKEGAQDKYMQSILVCPLFLAEDLRAGKHLSVIDFTMQYQNSGFWGTIKNNKNERYHHIDVDKRNHIDELVADFKFYYTIPRNSLYQNAEENYKISISALYRESLSQRFAYYLSRIGLPDKEYEKQV